MELYRYEAAGAPALSAIPALPLPRPPLRLQTLGLARGVSVINGKPAGSVAPMGVHNPAASEPLSKVGA